MNKYRIKPMASGLLAIGLALASLGSVAGERESLEQLRNTTLSLIDMLVKEGVLSKANADHLVKEAQAAKQSDKTDQEISEQVNTATDKVVRVQYVPESVKAQLRDEIKNEVMTNLNYKAGERLGLPDWIDRFTFEGDIRLRYELDKFASSNAPYQIFNQYQFRQSNIANTTENINRFRVRARLGTTIKITDWLDGGIRMTTGSPLDPTTENQTLQTADAKYSFGLDRAYLKAKPYSWLSLSGGRVANPWFSTDLMWTTDLAFDGLVAAATPKINDRLSTFVTVGAFPMQEIQSSSTNKAKDKWIYGAQGGVKWKFADDSSLKVGLAYYDFSHVEGQMNDPLIPGQYDATVPVFRQKGNNTFDINANTGTTTCGGGSTNTGCGLASQFKVLNLTGQYDWAAFNPAHVILTADYIRNIGFDANEIFTRTGNIYKNETQGYQVKLAVGMPETTHKGDWQVFGTYKRIEADATLDAYTDADFNLGGTDTKGFIVGASYGLDKNVWTTARWFSSDQISGLPLSIDVLMFDIQAKF